MRILFANSIQMFGGAEVWFLQMARALRSRGRWVGLVCRPGTELQAKAVREGVPVFPFRFGADMGPIAVLRAMALLRKLRPDIVCTNQDKELRTFGVASRVTGIGKVVHRRAIDHPLKDTVRYRFTYTKLADVVVANSQATRRTLLRSAPWLQPAHVEVIYNGVDPTLFDGDPDSDLRASWGWSAADFVVGFVGQLDERKGIGVLLQAFERVAAARSEARLLLVGKGPLAHQVEEFRKASPWGTRVLHVGFREDIPRIMRSLDVLVLPSFWEGFGIVLIEAMAAGKPVVASRTSSIPEIVVDGETGFLVPPGDSGALADGLLRLAQDRELALAMGKRGRERVHRWFTLDRMVDQWESIFQRLATGRPSH
ncbi:MAG: glycosyltransferase family 4 protein [candidate division KSB1 bacterium]|nr:glycosyltransferase family 4 protein [candidate division KSB1 bacterium]